MVPEARQLASGVAGTGRSAPTPRVRCALDRMRQSARVAVIAMGGLAGLFQAGCASKSSAPIGPVADTGGHSLRLRVQHPSEQRYELFQVSREGRIGWAGGMDAMEATTKISFERDLTADEAQAFRDAMAKCAWAEAKPDDRGPDKAEPITAVAIGLPNGVERTFTLRGDQPEVNAWLKLLKPWAASRHKRHLERLPEATEPPKGQADSE